MPHLFLFSRLLRRHDTWGFAWNKKDAFFTIFFFSLLKVWIFFDFFFVGWERNLGTDGKRNLLGFAYYRLSSFLHLCITHPFFTFFSFRVPSRELGLGGLLFWVHIGEAAFFSQYLVHLTIPFCFVFFFSYEAPTPCFIPGHGRVLGWIQVIEDTPWLLLIIYFFLTWEFSLFLNS